MDISLSKLWEIAKEGKPDVMQFMGSWTLKELDTT